MSITSGIRGIVSHHPLVLAGGILCTILLLVWALWPGVPDFEKFEPGPERKVAFLEYLLPLIEAQNRETLDARELLQAWHRDRDSIGWWDNRKLRAIAAHYRVADFDTRRDADWRKLISHVDIVPPSLALAQAANESAWGTSRFAREANNYYGQWCYVPGCGVVPARRVPGKTHEIAAFDSPAESVAMYMHNLNSNPAYRSLRTIRSQLRAANKPVTGIALAGGLLRYSERGEEYIKDLRSMIRHNQLTQYDAS